MCDEPETETLMCVLMAAPLFLKLILPFLFASLAGTVSSWVHLEIKTNVVTNFVRNTKIVNAIYL